jgi:hypothetical protein
MKLMIEYNLDSEVIMASKIQFEAKKAASKRRRKLRKLPGLCCRESNARKSTYAVERPVPGIPSEELSVYYCKA